MLWGYPGLRFKRIMCIITESYKIDIFMNRRI